MAVGIDPKWETHLRPQYMKVAVLLSPSRHHLASRLFSKHLLTASEEEEFNKLSKSKSEEEVAKEILGVLRKQSVGSFDKFCEVLSDVGDSTLDDVVKRLRQDSIDGKDLLEQIFQMFISFEDCFQMLARPTRPTSLVVFS